MAGPLDDDSETESRTPARWSGRALKRGRWADVGDGAALAHKRADKTLSVRLKAVELAAFAAQIAALGLKRSMALRIAARRVAGFVAGFIEVDAATVEALRGVARQIGGVATNISQIAKAANRTRDPDVRAFMEERAALGSDLARVEGLLQRLLELGARRADGLARLTAAGPVRRAPRRARKESRVP